MTKVRSVTAPMKFYVGKGIFKELPEYTETLGQKPFIIADPFIYERATDELGSAYEQSEIVEFGGENAPSEIEKNAEKVKESEADYVIGIGGGKTMDNAKAVANEASKSVVVVPTLAASDAPATSLSVQYTEEGEMDQYLFFPYNPDIVIADLEILAQAPAATFSAGMADAISTWIEGRKSFQTNGENLTGNTASYTGYQIAKSTYETIRKYGVQALNAVENGQATAAVSNVVEANIWMSAVGAEAVGLTAAHAIHNGLTQHTSIEGQHGEIVAFSLIATLLLESASDEEIYDLANFLKEIKLPLTLEDLGVDEWNEEEMMKVAEAAAADDETASNMTQQVTPDDVYTAIQQADNMMQQVKDGYKYNI